MQLTDDNLYITYILQNRTQDEMMEIFGMKRSTLQKTLRKAGLKKVTDVPEDFAKMYGKGLTYSELADYYDVEESLIKSWIKRTGVRRVPYQKRGGVYASVR